MDPTQIYVDHINEGYKVGRESPRDFNRWPHVKFHSLRMESVYEDPIPSLQFERSIVIIIRFLASACSGSDDFDGFEFFGV